MVYVLTKLDIASDVRVDAGGGEIGWTTVLGVFSTRELAEDCKEEDLRSRFREVREDIMASWEGFKEEFVGEWLDYDIKECEIDQCGQ